MKVSVIIPTLDDGGDLEVAVGSVLAQTHEAAQIVVIDNGSSDGSVQRVEALGCDRIEIRRCLRRGSAAARNVGLRQLDGDAVAFLDADDRWLPEHLASVVARLEQCGLGPGDRFLYAGKAFLTDATTGVAQVSEPERTDAPEAFSLAVGNRVVTSAAVVDAKSACTLEFDERLRSGQDRAFWIDCLESGAVFVAGEVASVVHIRRPWKRGMASAIKSDLLLLASARTEWHWSWSRVARLAAFGVVRQWTLMVLRSTRWRRR